MKELHIFYKKEEIPFHFLEGSGSDRNYRPVEMVVGIDIWDETGKRYTLDEIKQMDIPKDIEFFTNLPTGKI